MGQMLNCAVDHLDHGPIAAIAATGRLPHSGATSTVADTTRTIRYLPSGERTETPSARSLTRPRTETFRKRRAGTSHLRAFGFMTFGIRLRPNERASFR
jgi:hypothetical protein